MSLGSVEEVGTAAQLLLEHWPKCWLWPQNFKAVHSSINTTLIGKLILALSQHDSFFVNLDFLFSLACLQNFHEIQGFRITFMQLNVNLELCLKNYARTTKKGTKKFLSDLLTSLYPDLNYGPEAGHILQKNNTACRRWHIYL